MVIRSTVTIDDHPLGGRSSSERVIVLGDRGPNIHCCISIPAHAPPYIDASAPLMETFIVRADRPPARQKDGFH
ncbi:jg16048 [Pararge aegeria aegeria]|uniref:Jg16048 protein n=1 Tax=Pararge aegeria aegeria TaxID=348720 RepID=A0A8S4SRA3_9NEOP|nr:jg16048 [Pararge aegeria aegeria]